MHWVMNGAELYYPKDCVELAPQLIYSPSFEEHRDPPHGQGHLTDGMHVVVRHWVYGCEKQEGPAFNCDGPGNEDLAFEDITIYQCPGHGFVGYGCERGIRISRNRIQRRREKNYLVSATADGVHFGTMKGDLIVEDCDFSHHGDDSVNIHGTWMTVVSKLDARTLRLTCNWNDWHARLDAGDLIKFCEQRHSADIGAPRRILSVEVEHPDLSHGQGTLQETHGRHKLTNVYTVVLDGDAPAELQPGDLIANVTRACSRFVIRNNYFHDHRARGMILQCTDGLVENNHIKNTMGSGFHLTSNLTFWKEGYGAQRVILRGNLIEGCNFAMWERGPIGRHMAAVTVAVETPQGLGEEPLHCDLLIEGNTVRNTPGLAFQISSAKNVVLRENRIEDSNLEPFQGTGSAIGDSADGSIMVTKSTNVEITGNRLRNHRKTYATRIYLTDSAKDVRLENNEGFE